MGTGNFSVECCSTHIRETAASGKNGPFAGHYIPKFWNISAIDDWLSKRAWGPRVHFACSTRWLYHNPISYPADRRDTYKYWNTFLESIGGSGWFFSAGMGARPTSAGGTNRSTATSCSIFRPNDRCLLTRIFLLLEEWGLLFYTRGGMMSECRPLLRRSQFSSVQRSGLLTMKPWI